MSRKKNTLQIVLLVVAYLVCFALLFSVFKQALDKPAEEPGVNQPSTDKPSNPGTDTPGTDQPGTDAPDAAFYLVVNGQYVVDQGTADLVKGLNVQVVSETDTFEYTLCQNTIPSDKYFTFTVDESTYAMAGSGNADHADGFTIAVNGKNLTISATSIADVLTKKYHATSFAFGEKLPTVGFPYFVLEVTSGTKTISVLLTMPNLGLRG